jgi:DNA invertase Pin-like site-specific DNA recombinase
LNSVIYLRVSDQQQTLGSSLADQERACRAFAAQHGYKVTAVYRDDGKSAWKDELRYRPQFEKMIAAGRVRLIEHQVKLLRQNGAPVAIVWLRAPRGIERFE